MSPGSRSSPADVGRPLRRIGALLLVATVGVCPLLAGTVHRPAIVAILAGVTLAFVCAMLGERWRGRALRGRQFAIVFALLVLIPLGQVLPLPSFLRATIDAGGLALLENAPGGTPRMWPLSLDPVSTLGEIGTAAATLVVFLLAIHNATGRRRRTLVLNAIAAAGLFAVASGIAHRIFGIDLLYGLFPLLGSVIPGPLINPNHSAEFFELAAFAALALALDADAEIRIGWYVAAGVNAAAAVTTLSRGSLLALVAGGTTFVLLRIAAGRTRGERTARSGAGRARKTLGWSLLALGGLVAIALALGASPVLDELARTNLTDGSEKIVVWKDALSIILRHPLGIGRHAFDRVYPVYKTLLFDRRFQFVENGPLQLLIDVGWPGFATLGIALVWLARKVPWRWDDVGAALAAALVAVLAHNLVDFGLETAGIRLPFAAMAGVLIGRAYGRAPTDQSAGKAPGGRGIGIAATAVAAIGLVVGFWAQFQTTADDFEDQWKRAGNSEGRRQLAIQGGLRFPTDFYFPLLQSYDESLRPGASGGSSPRLAALNRAMRLCPTCPVVHEQAARALYRLGLRVQALSSFRDTVRLAPPRLPDLLHELDSLGYGLPDLATLAVGAGPETLTVAKYLVPKKAEAEVGDLLELAGRQGVSAVDRLLVKADLAMALRDPTAARAALSEARRLAPRDGRSYATMSILEEQEGHLEVALDQARAATTMSPLVVDFSRRRLGLVLLLHRWSELDDTLDRLKIALRHNGKKIAEVHMVAGQTHQARGNLERALSEFRTATMLDAANPAVWAAVGRVSEQRGDLSGAVEAYQHASNLQPGDVGLRQDVERVEKARSDTRLRELLP